MLFVAKFGIYIHPILTIFVWLFHIFIKLNRILFWSTLKSIRFLMLSCDIIVEYILKLTIIIWVLHKYSFEIYWYSFDIVLKFIQDFSIFVQCFSIIRSRLQEIHSILIGWCGHVVSYGQSESSRGFLWPIRIELISCNLERIIENLEWIFEKYWMNYWNISNEYLN